MSFQGIKQKLNVYTYPKEITIPKIELVIYKALEEKSVYDSNNLPILNKDGSYKSIIKNTTKHLRWNGKKFVPIK